jgi:SAM-dependent methyltransferase
VNPVSQVTARLTPEDWQRVYEGSGGNDGYHGFRRVTDVAEGLCATLAADGARWLDVGCGTGELLSRLRRNSAIDALGIDHDSAMIAYAARRDRERPGAGRVRFAVGDAYRLPVAGGVVDGVSAILLSGCLREPDRFVAEACRVLRPGGHLVASFTCGDAVTVRAWDWWRRARRTQISAVRRDAYRRYALDEVGALFAAHGMVVTRLLHLNCYFEARRLVVPPLRVGRWLESTAPLGLRRRLCAHLLVVARA